MMYRYWGRGSGDKTKVKYIQYILYIFQNITMTRNISNIMTFEEVVNKFINMLAPYPREDFYISKYEDDDDADAMSSDVIGYLQQELNKQGCTLIAYSFDGIITGEYTVIGNKNNYMPNTAYTPQCIYPRQPIYTEKPLDD